LLVKKEKRRSITCFTETKFENMLQFSTDELVKEVENSITEFKRQRQEYDEERIREQVCVHCP
jgi:hypothetical protein